MHFSCFCCSGCSVFEVNIHSMFLFQVMKSTIQLEQILLFASWKEWGSRMTRQLLLSREQMIILMGMTFSEKKYFKYKYMPLLLRHLQWFRQITTQALCSFFKKKSSTDNIPNYTQTSSKKINSLHQLPVKNREALYDAFESRPMQGSSETIFH